MPNTSYRIRCALNFVAILLLLVTTCNCFTTLSTTSSASQRTRLFEKEINSPQQGKEDEKPSQPDLFVETMTSTRQHDETKSPDIVVEEADEWERTLVYRDQKPEEAEWERTVVYRDQKPGSEVVEEDQVVLPQQQRRRNIAVAIASVLFAVCNYGWQLLHPVTPIQLLTEMEQQSVPVTEIGRNGKPTVVDFWAPWCENCKLAAPTLQKVENEYRDRVNFVMINGDQAKAWPYIEKFGVDAIPHLALVTAEGDVETALIGPVPKSVLEADIKVLIDNKNSKQKTPLPYVMLDVFANRPDERRVRFDP